MTRTSYLNPFLPVNLFLTALVVALMAGCATAPIPVYSPPPEPAIQKSVQESRPPGQRIRVAIAVRRPSVTVAAPETYTWSGLPSGSNPVVVSGPKRFREVFLTSNRLLRGTVAVEPAGVSGEILVGGRSYRGTMEVTKDSGGTLTVINDVPLEDYVMGVLAGEVSPQWPLEALKAQAIAARTFALLKRVSKPKGEPYDLDNSQSYQMYQGSGMVNANIQRAVLQTRGQVLIYKNTPVEAFFHSNCGGRTSRARDVWGRDLPYLQSVSCPFCRKGSHFRWATKVPIRDLVRNLRKSGMAVGDVVRLNGVDRDESDRFRRVEIMDDDGRYKSLKGIDFRKAVGSDLIRSTNFNAIVEGDAVVFNGKGCGHGVGLCQEGAYGMAIRGYTAFEILRHYYRGIMIEKLKD